jgi:hypothetical protein
VEDASIAQQVTCLLNTLANVNQKVGNMEILVSSLPTIFIYSNKLMAEQNKLLRRVVSQKYEESTLFKRKLGESPPRQCCCVTSHKSFTDAAANAAIPDNLSPLVAGPPGKKLKNNSTLEELLDGISKVLTTIGGISVKDAFMEMREEDRLISLCEELSDMQIAPRSCLFDCKSDLFLGLHDAFAQVSSQKKYCDAMTLLVAMGINKDDWVLIVREELTDIEFRNKTDLIQKSTMNTAISLEIELGLKEPSNKVDKSRPSLSSLALRMQVMRKHWTKVQKKFYSAKDWQQGTNNANTHSWFL